ncbi:MAG: protease modulator HflC, partial [Geminicoccaceae bacterium]|nr:protease modulator HflC [Geminicoccaceae bacterium]
ANQEAQQFGIDIVDVRIKRADLPAENSQAIYRRMQTEREREAKELRAQGAELAQRIRSRADRERRVIIAEAQKEAQIIRGEGDGQKTAIFADAFGQDIDFFEFYRSMQAYRDALGDANTSFVLSPDSEFFRYFGGTAVSGAADGAGGSIQPGSGDATPPQQQSDAGGSAAPATPAGATSGEDDAEEVDAQADATGSAAVVQQGATRPSSVVD